MQTLRIEVAGRALSFPPDKVVRIGRSIDADVVLAAVSVSRHHAELRPGPQGWMLADVGSSGGTYVGGARITEIPVTGPFEVQCGPPAAGSTFTVTLDDQVPAGLPPAQAPAPPPPPAWPGPAYPGVVAPPTAPMPAPAPQPYSPYAPPVPRAPAPPGAAYVPPPGPGPSYDAGELTIAPGMGRPILPGVPPQPVTGPDLLVVAEGKEYRFRHPATITVGRLPECDVVVADQAVSRQHARIIAKPGGWVFQNASQAGSYADGRPVASLDFDEATDLRLGHPVAGELLSLVPIHSAQEEVARFARKRRKRLLVRVGAVAAALVVIAGVTVGLVLGLGGGDDAQGLTEATADKDKAATVFIYAQTSSSAWTGSGSILTKDGKILTNCHVADPAKVPGEGGQSPDYVYISLTDAKDGYKASEPKYRAKVVADDGNLDAAVIQIYADADGNPVDPSSLDLPTMQMGDSGKVEEGQAVTVFGFPGLAREGTPKSFDDLLAPPSQTDGDIATIITAKGERTVFDVTARIAPGNSGGAAVDNAGKLIGVPTRVSSDKETGVSSGRVQPLSYMAPVLEKAGITVP